MTKLLSILSLVAFSALSLNAQAASHAGGAPMKASAPEAAASGAKADMKKQGAKHEAKHEAKHADKAEKKTDKK